MQALLVGFYKLFIYPIVMVITHVLPASPFRSFLVHSNPEYEPVMVAIHYFVPVEDLSRITLAWLIAMFIWYFWRWLIDFIHNVSLTDIIDRVSSWFQPKT